MNIESESTIYKTPEGEIQILQSYRSVIDGWPIEKKEHVLKTDYGETFVIESGAAEAPVMVLLHGTASNSSMWIDEVETLAEKFHVYAIDMPGEPGLSTQNRMSWQDDTYSIWLQEVLNQLDLKKIILVGASLGGWAALNYSVQYPSNVLQLVLLGPSGLARPRVHFFFQHLWYSLQGKKGVKKLIQALMPNQNVGQSVLEHFNRLNRAFIYRKEFPKVYESEQLNRLTMPVHYFGGGKDILVNTEDSAKNLRLNVDSARVNIMEDRGHVLADMAPLILDSIAEDLQETKRHYAKQ